MVILESSLGQVSTNVDTMSRKIEASSSSEDFCHAPNQISHELIFLRGDRRRLTIFPNFQYTQEYKSFH